MKKILFALLFLISFTVFPQSSTSSINTRITDSITTNNGRQITGAILNRLLKDMNTSYVNKTTDAYVKGAATPLSVTSNTVSIPRATASVNGYLDSADFQAFSGTTTGGQLFFAKAATTTSLTAVTYSTNTLTATANGALAAIDGISLGVDDFLLVKNQTATLQNGIYYVLSLGSAGTPYVLVRDSTYNETAEVYPSQVNALSGTVNGTKYFLQTTVDPVIGTNPITYTTIPTPVSTGNIYTSNGSLGANRTVNLNGKRLTFSGSARVVTIASTGAVGVGVTTPLAALDVTSTTSAFLPPRMTTVQRDAIASPVNGMVIYNSTTGLFNGYQGGAWSGIKPSISVQTATTLTITPTTVDDFVTESSLNGAIVIANPTGTWVEGQTCLIRIKDDGTARAITFGGNYVAFGAALPTTTTISKWLMIGLVYNAIDSKWSTWSSVQQ